MALRTLAVLGGVASVCGLPKLTKEQAGRLVDDFTAKNYHIPSALIAMSKGEEDLSTTGMPAEWDEEEDGAWEPVEWEPVWWTNAPEEGVRFIEHYDAMHESDMTYRQDGFRYRILKNGNTGLQAFGPSTDCKILGVGWTVDQYPLGRPYMWEKNRKKPMKIRSTNFNHCWVSALNYMEIGSTWEFVCTPELGFGNEAVDGIPAGSAMIFRLELLSCSATRELPEIVDDEDDWDLEEEDAFDDGEDELGFEDGAEL